LFCFASSVQEPSTLEDEAGAGGMKAKAETVPQPDNLPGRIQVMEARQNKEANALEILE
jgi:hypothetical protein